MKIVFIGGFILLLLISVALWFVSRRAAIAVLLLGLITGAGAYRYRAKLTRLIKPMFHQIKNQTSPNLCSVSTKSLRLKKNDYYKLHIPAAKKRGGMKLVSSTTERDKLIDSNVLVPIKGMTGYSVRKMNYGSPHVHSDTKIMLDELQQRFAVALEDADLGHTKIVISSAYRTTDQHSRLRKNLPPGKASRGASSHSYGASVDIPALKGISCAKAKPHFQKVLSEMQKEGRLYICPESDTIHITVR